MGSFNGVTNRVLRLAPPSTVGGAELAARYAEVVLLVTMRQGVQAAFYGMLSERVSMHMKLW